MQGTVLPAKTLQTLPTLVKVTGNLPYQILIPKEFERKIRLLCDLSPDIEWSGILFYEPSGSFENSLTIVCKDIFLMDIGTATYTEIDWETPEIAQYMVSHLELFDCKMGLIHSHNKMATFFSGTDQNTLRAEGNDMNVFVSLIVNNAGEYTAGITKRVIDSIDRTITDKVSSKHLFFEGATVDDGTSEKVTNESLENTVIKWYDLSVNKEKVSTKEMEVLTEDELALKERFNAIKKEKEERAIKSTRIYPNSISPWWETSASSDRYFWSDSLFKDDDAVVEDTSKINWNRYPGVRKAFWWFVSGSPWSYPAYSLPDIWRVFPTDYQYLDWLQINLDYILTNLDIFGLDKLAEDYHMEDVELTAAVINRFKEIMPGKGSPAYDMIMQTLEYYSL